MKVYRIRQVRTCSDSGQFGRVGQAFRVTEREARIADRFLHLAGHGDHQLRLDAKAFYRVGYTFLICAGAESLLVERVR